MRNIVVSCLAACSVLSAFGNPASAQTQTGTRPNILLIVGDDIAFGDLGFAGGLTRTPSIDRLAEQGVAFTRFHASPVCSVTRGRVLGIAGYGFYTSFAGRPVFGESLLRE